MGIKGRHVGCFGALIVSASWFNRASIRAECGYHL
jgi:hypothetical protein